MFTWIEGYDVQKTRRISRKEGFEEGMKQGVKQGEIIGEKRAGERMLQAKEQSAREMKADGMDVALIKKYTGLTEEIIAKL